MAKLTTSRLYHKDIQANIFDKIDEDNSSIDYLLLRGVIADYMCFRAFAEFDSNVNVVLKSFLRSRQIEPKYKELGRLKPNEIKKYLRQKFKIPNTKLSFLDNREDFTLFLINRHTISHTASSGSIPFEEILKYIDEADEIVEKINNVLITYGKITKKTKFIDKCKMLLNKFHGAIMGH